MCVPVKLYETMKISTHGNPRVGRAFDFYDGKIVWEYLDMQQHPLGVRLYGINPRDFAESANLWVVTLPRSHLGSSWQARWHARTLQRAFSRSAKQSVTDQPLELCSKRAVCHLLLVSGGRGPRALSHALAKNQMRHLRRPHLMRAKLTTGCPSVSPRCC